MSKSTMTGLIVVALCAASGTVHAQSTGGSPNDPNNARNQFPAPSATQPTDPAAEYDPLSRVPTAPESRLDASSQPGGQTGYRPSGLPPAPAVGPPEVVDRPGLPAPSDPY